MSRLAEIHWTCNSVEEAESITLFLLEEKLIACSQIIKNIESAYIWENKLVTTTETKVILKTIDIHFKEIKKVILTKGSYEIPEISMVIIEASNDEYVAWVKNQTQRIHDL